MSWLICSRIQLNRMCGQELFPSPMTRNYPQSCKTRSTKCEAEGRERGSVFFFGGGVATPSHQLKGNAVSGPRPRLQMHCGTFRAQKMRQETICHEIRGNFCPWANLDKLHPSSPCISWGQRCDSSCVHFPHVLDVPECDERRELIKRVNQIKSNQICLIQTARSIQIYRIMMMMMVMKRVSHNIKAIRTIGKHTHQHYILTTKCRCKMSDSINGSGYCYVCSESVYSN